MDTLLIENHEPRLIVIAQIQVTNKWNKVLR